MRIMEDWRSIIARQDAEELGKKTKEEAKTKEELFLKQAAQTALKTYKILEKLRYIQRDVWHTGEIQETVKRSRGFAVYGYELGFNYLTPKEYTYIRHEDGSSFEHGTSRYHATNGRTYLGLYIELSGEKPKRIIVDDCINHSNDRYSDFSFIDGRRSFIEINNFPQNIHDEDQKLQLELARDCQHRILSNDLQIKGRLEIEKIKDYPFLEEAKKAGSINNRYKKSFWKTLFG